MPEVKKNKKAMCRVCGTKIKGKGRCYCDNCRPSVNQCGYVLVHRPDHPRANRGGYVREHILVMEKKISRPLKNGEIVHHIDGDRSNNMPDNLMLFSSNGAHTRHHALLKRKARLTSLFCITPDQWRAVWRLDDHADWPAYFASIGVSGLAISRATVIVGRAQVRMITKAEPRLLRTHSSQEMLDRFESEFVEYAMAQVVSLKNQAW